MSVSRRFAQLFNVQPKEESLVFLLISFFFFLGAAYLAFETAAYALFIETFGAQNLGYTYIAIAVGVSVIAYVYLKLTDWIPLRRLLVINLVSLLVITLLLRLGMEITESRWLRFVLPVWEMGLTNLGNVAFWGVVGRIFDVRQSKRLSGVVGSGRWFAAVAGGLTIPLLVSDIGTENLLFVAAGGVALAIPILITLLRRYPDAFDVETRLVMPESQRTQEAANQLLRNRYIVLIFIVHFIWAGSIFFVDNIFFRQASAQYTNAAQLAGFTSQIAAVSGLLTLFMTLFLSGRLLTRYGLAGGLLLMPLLITLILAVLTLAGAASASAAVLLAIVTILQIVVRVTHNGVMVPAQRVLAQPLPPAQGTRVSAINAGYIEPISAGAAGVLLLVLTSNFGFDTVELAAAYLLIGLAWIGVSVLLMRAYPQALSQAIAKRRFGEAGLQVEDSVSMAVLHVGLNDPHPEAVIYTLNLIEQTEALPSMELRLASMLSHPSPDVRRDVLGRIRRHEFRGALPAVEALLVNETKPEVKAAALSTLAALGERDAFEKVAVELNNTDPVIQRGAMVGLLQSGGLDGILLAGQKLTGMLSAPQPSERESGVRILGDVGISNFYQPIVPLLNDPEKTVRRTALVAAGKINHPRLWSRVVEGLASTETHTAAAAALVAGGEAVIPNIREAYLRPHQQRAMKVRLVRVCGRIRGQAAMDFLDSLLEAPDSEVRSAVYNALSACGYRTSDLARIRQQLRAEAEYAVHLLAILNDLGDAAPTGLVRDALHYQLRQGRERLLLLLSFVYDSTAMLRAREAFNYGAPRQRAYALEAVDTLLPKDMKPLVLPLLEEASPAQKLAHLTTLFPQQRCTPEDRLLELLDSPSPWMQMTALYAAGQMNSTALQPAIAAAANSSDLVIQETARWALARLNTPAITKDTQPMLTTIEKVIILKSVSMFAETPDEVLIEVASLLEEIRLKAGERLFEKGDLGNSMYMVVTGKMRVHDGDRLLNYRQAREVFGEMALLDPEPRVASVTAEEDTLLFRLDQEPFYDLMADRVEVVRGIMRVITGNLRARVKDVADLHVRIQELEQALKQR
ncbi:MAG: Npt1/Npt2 family nucleotide transporter [bacterium]|nr:Npt1/Npt2 family nucleotide transporter [bacterium]